jgi:hypothetical protein
MLKRDYDSAIAEFRRMTSPLELEREGKQEACGPLIMTGHFAEAERELQDGLVADSGAGPSSHRETNRLWLAHLHWLMDQPESARARAFETARLPPLPIYMQFLAPAAGVGFLLRDFSILRQVTDSASKIAANWPSTYTRGSGALCRALSSWASEDMHGASAAFDEVRGLWADPWTLFWVARWQAANGDYSAALSTSEHLQAAEGAVLRRYFTGLAVLGWITQAECLSGLSRFEDASRLYKQVLDHWGHHAGTFTVVREAQTEHLAISKRSRNK